MVFSPDGLEKKLVELAAKGTNIKIIWADPYSDEVMLQSEAENKPGKIKDHIFLLHNIFESHINALSDKKRKQCQDHLQMLYSTMLPKGWIVKADNLIFYTPYFLSGPYEEQVFILSGSNGESQSMFNRINNYIKQLMKDSKKYSE